MPKESWIKISKLDIINFLPKWIFNMQWLQHAVTCGDRQANFALLYLLIWPLQQLLLHRIDELNGWKIKEWLASAREQYDSDIYEMYAIGELWKLLYNIYCTLLILFCEPVYRIRISVEISKHARLKAALPAILFRQS